MSQPDEPFFHRDGERYVPTLSAQGPWATGSLHGRVLAGLLMHVVERDHLGPDFQVARMTMDLFKLTQLAPVTVTTRLARSGNRIKVLDASAAAGDVEVGRASIVMLRRAEAPPGTVWAPPEWDAPPVHTLPEPDPPIIDPFTGIRTWDMRLIQGGFDNALRKRAWVRDFIDLCDDVPLSPLVRAALVADFANPLANIGDRGLQYINADFTLSLHRDPEGEWIGVDATAHQAADGIALGECALYDGQGLFGQTIVCAVANQRREEPRAITDDGRDEGAIARDARNEAAS
jgi:hypothetical protein